MILRPTPKNCCRGWVSLHKVHTKWASTVWNISKVKDSDIWMDQQRITDRFQFKLSIIEIEMTARRFGITISGPSVYFSHVKCQYGKYQHHNLGNYEGVQLEYWPLVPTPTQEWMHIAEEHAYWIIVWISGLFHYPCTLPKWNLKRDLLELFDQARKYESLFQVSGLPCIFGGLSE